MKNFVQHGYVISLTAPYAVTSGDGMLVGSLFGVATTTAANGGSVEALVRGVIKITALSTDTGTVGTKVYWDNTNKRITTTAGSHTLVGCLTVAKTSGQTTATVLLNGTVV
jgi:predicted RecA/RadA family phage recombinase